MFKTIVVVFLVAAVNPAFSVPAQVTETDIEGKVAIISNEVSQGPWIPMQDVCLVRDEKEVACGKILKSNDKAAEVQILFQKEQIAVGDRVVYANQVASDNSLVQSAVRWGKAQPERLLLAFGALASADFALMVPTVQAQYLFSKRGAFGLQPSFLSQTLKGSTTAGDVNVASMGLLATIQFYSERHLVGFWVQLGLGPQYVKLSSVAENPTGSFVVAGASTVGWRVEIAQPLNLGMGVGVLYLPFPGDLTPGFSPVRLITQMDLGITL